MQVSCHNQLFALEMVEMAVAVVVEKVISEVKSWLQQRLAERYREGIQALMSWWHTTIDLEEDDVEK
jgi:elongation factor P hydroxylase